jgi:pentatricopeptide repeat domain-containing protein 1
VKPDVYSYNALISACEKGGQWERAVEVFEEMKAAGVKPDVITYSALITACEKGAQWT